MGHYFTIDFDAKLTDKGLDIIKELYFQLDEWQFERDSNKDVWEETAKIFTEYAFLEQMCNVTDNYFCFSEHNKDPDKQGWNIDYENKIWSVHVDVKDHGFDAENFFEHVFPYLISEPCEVLWWHELSHWDEDKWREKIKYTIQPKLLPKPDWFRKLGGPYDP